MTTRHTEGVKARYTMRCECCRSVIEVGSRYVMFHGRPWITKHMIEYRQRRHVTQNDQSLV